MAKHMNDFARKLYDQVNTKLCNPHFNEMQLFISDDFTLYWWKLNSDYNT